MSRTTSVYSNNNILSSFARGYFSWKYRWLWNFLFILITIFSYLVSSTIWTTEKQTLLTWCLSEKQCMCVEKYQLKPISLRVPSAKVLYLTCTCIEHAKGWCSCMQASNCKLYVNKCRSQILVMDSLWMLIKTNLNMANIWLTIDRYMYFILFPKLVPSFHLKRWSCFDPIWIRYP